MTKIWYQTPEILFKNLDQFLPNKKLSKVENINSIVRFAIYFSIIILLLKQNIKWLLLSLLLLIISYYLNVTDNIKSVYFYNSTPLNNEKFTINNESTNIVTKSSIDNPYMNYIINNNTQSTNVYPKILPDNISMNSDPITSLNIYTNNNNKEIRLESNIPSQDIPYNTEQNNTINYDLCLTSDNNKPCIADNKNNIDPDTLPQKFKINEDLKKEIRKNYKSHLKFDSIDIWGQFINDRNYYTLPNTEIVNEQTEFAKWCYTNNNKSGDCKTYGVNCVKDRDVRYHRGRVSINNE